MTQTTGAAAAAANVAVYDALENESYIDEAPHLKHESLRQLYTRLTTSVLTRIGKAPADLRVLDLGAGEGSVTMRFLEMGARVTAVDSSELQLSYLRRRAAEYSDRLAMRRGDVFGAISEEQRAGNRFDLVISNSFLHHIPDYVQLTKGATEVIGPGGVLFTFQDPLRFSSLALPVRAFTGTAYLAWRITKPDVIRGLGRRARRIFGVYRDDSPEDNAEYHVVRDGVDQDLIAATLRGAGMKVEVVRYFSTQSPFWQRLGARLGIANTFAVIGQKS